MPIMADTSKPVNTEYRLHDMDGPILAVSAFVRRRPTHMAASAMSFVSAMRSSSAALQRLEWAHLSFFFGGGGGSFLII